MAEIVLKTDKPDKAVEVLKEALETETLRLKYSLNLAKRRLKRFEAKYNISSKKFMNEWSAEDLKGKDLEYVVTPLSLQAVPITDGGTWGRS